MFLFRKYAYPKIISVIWITQISLFDSRLRHFIFFLHKDPHNLPMHTVGFTPG
jgi:hypothetical protein